MAGLRHNPAALYCTKREELGEDAPGGLVDARCDYCDARGLGPKTDVPDDASTEGAEIDQRPPIAKFLERVGVVKGARVADLRLVDQTMFHGVYVVEDIAALVDVHDVVLTLREDSTPRRVRVRWQHVTSWLPPRA